MAAKRTFKGLEQRARLLGAVQVVDPRGEQLCHVRRARVVLRGVEDRGRGEVELIVGRVAALRKVESRRAPLLPVVRRVAERRLRDEAQRLELKAVEAVPWHDAHSA